MQPAMPALFLELSRTSLSMSGVGLALLVIGLWTAKSDIARASGIDKVVALTNLCFAIPLAIFGAEHLSGAIPLNMVPRYVPWHEFWIYFVGVALIAAALSIATKIWVQWSALLFGIMMFLFVAMLHLPGALNAGGRLPWTIVLRESSFGSGGLVLAGVAMAEIRDAQGKWMINVGRVLIGMVAIFFGVQHFLHPLALPGVPLQKETPAWVPVRALVDYVTGALLITAGICFLLLQKVRTAATYLGAWLVLLVVVIYGPVLIGALADARPGTQIEGLNYFADTLLFAGVILSLACAAITLPGKARR